MRSAIFIWAFVHVVIAINPAQGISFVTDVPPAELESMPIPVVVEAEKQDGMVTFRITATLPDDMSEKRLTAFLKIAYDDEVIVWTSLAQWPLRSDRQFQYVTSVGELYLDASYVELRIWAANNMPTFDGFRFHLDPFVKDILGEAEAE